MSEAILHLGDCLDIMPTLADNSIDAIVTDPPYGLSFMGKDWDHGVPGVHFWQEALRVAKPGAHLLAFGGTRTFHRLAVAIEDAGWEIRDTIGWLYGQGFPKSHNLNGEWQGWGTALKPAWEPVIVARKPLAGTVAANVQEWGTGAMNIDGCRIESNGTHGSAASAGLVQDPRPGIAYSGGIISPPHPAGRWPSNLIHDGSDEVLAGFPVTTSGGGNKSRNGNTAHTACYGTYKAPPPDVREIDTGSAARFFYCAKASKADRDEGCEGLEERQPTFGNNKGDGLGRGISNTRQDWQRRNHHPTVKPTDLMRYLCRLVTPPGGVVLDPFMGSGSTGKAAILEGFRFVGIEMNTDYLEIARARIEHAQSKALPLLMELTETTP